MTAILGKTFYSIVSGFLPQCNRTVVPCLSNNRCKIRRLYSIDRNQVIVHSGNGLGTVSIRSFEFILGMRWPGSGILAFADNLIPTAVVKSMNYFVILRGNHQSFMVFTEPNGIIVLLPPPPLPTNALAYPPYAANYQR